VSLRLGVVFLVLGLCGCPVGLGEPCQEAAECRQGLVCRTVEAGGPGLCDYPLRTGGEACTTDRECEGALTCSNHFTANQRYGQCVPRLEAGQACFVARDCLSGVCDGATAEALGVCQ